MRSRIFLLLTLLTSWSMAVNADISYSVACSPQSCNSSFSFGGEFRAMYILPMSDSLTYGIETDYPSIFSPNWKALEVEPDCHFGFDVGIGGMCTMSGANVTLGWSHLDCNDTARRGASSTGRLGPLFLADPINDPFTFARGHVNFQYEAINFDFGLNVPFGQCLQANFFGGVGSAYIKQEVTSRFYSDIEQIELTVATPCKYIGIGPQVGLGLAFTLVESLKITGRAAGTLLMGSLKNHTEFKSSSPNQQEFGLPTPNEQRVTVPNRRQLVPALEGRLGVSYSCGCNLILEVGYEAKVYLGAIQSLDISSRAIIPAAGSAVSASAYHRTVGNFALAGPYASAMLLF